MPKNAVVRKTSRIVGMAAVLGTASALLLMGVPADAAVAAKAVLQARGI